MKKILTMSVLGMFVSLRVFAATEFNLSFSTAAPGGSYKPKNCVAVWVTTSGGTFVKTILRYAGSHKTDLTSWISAAGSSDADAVMGATRSSHTAPTTMVATWNLKNKAGAVVPDGTYLIKFECADGARQTYSFSFVKDSNAGTRTAGGNTYFKSISIAYNPPVTTNTAPVAQPQSVTTAEDTAKAITLVATDVEGNPLTYAIATTPSHGTLGTVSGSSVTYTPAANYFGPDSFTFTAKDASLTSTPATVSITVSPVNDLPVAQAQSVTTAEDTAKVITLAATDVETNVFSYAVVAAPAHGTLSAISSNQVTYTPVANYNGPDSFTFKANDGAADSAPATVSITATPVNDAPVAQPQSVSTPEDTAKAITLVAIDPENSPATYAILAGPAHGTLSVLTSNVVTYTPAANYFGPDSFTFQASEPPLVGPSATVSITVTPVNDLPVAQPQSVSTAEDTARVIMLAATDVETNLFSYAVVSGPSFGTLSAISSNRVTYTPTAHYNGPDSFTFKANDGSADSAAATVSITVTPVNDAPVVQAQSVSTAEDTPKAIILAATDVENDALTYAIATPPAHGTLGTIAGNIVTYTPAANYFGPDSFAFTAKDASLTSTPVTVSITVTPVNDAPVAQAQSVTTAEDTAKMITFMATDVEGNALTYAIMMSPMHGSLSVISSNVVTYTPEANYSGPDSFSFQASDANLSSMPVMVSITVTPVNDKPVAQAQSVSTTKDTAKVIMLGATDVEGDALAYTIASSPTHGTLSVISSNQVTYTPAANYFGPDSFSFTARDASLTSTPATVSITVTQVNTVPVAQPQSVSTAEDTPKEITLAATDGEGDALTYLIATSPAHGTLSAVTSNRVTYTPASNYNGPDSFTFQATDGSLTSIPATVSITVTPVNDTPVAQAQSVTTAEDTAKAITLVATDVDATPLIYAIVANPAHGTLSVVLTNKVTYTPATGYNGPDSFTFKANDGSLDSAPATVSITVTAVNDAPVAQAQSVSTAEDTAKVITLAAIDSDGDALSYLVATGPANGTLSAVTSNRVTYTPAANYNGPDSFTFQASDGSLTSPAALVSITVTAVNDAPVAQAQSVTTAEDTAKAITLAATDVEGDPLTYLIVTGPAHGTLSAVSSNQVTYTPVANYNGPDSFTFAAADASLTGMPATVSITVTPANDAPVAQAQSVTTAEDTAKEITLAAIDAEGDVLTYLVATAPAHGTLSAVTSNRVTYTPAANYNGPDSFTFTAKDFSLTSMPATVSITVTAVNDAPVAQEQNVITEEDVPNAITLVATDVEGDALTYLIATPPAHGALSAISSNQVTYTPAANYFGPDTFAFRAADGSLTGATAIVSITVTPVNDAPVAQPQSVTTAKDTAKMITLVATDVDGDALVYLIATVPAHGTLSAVTSNRVTYTPAANYFGPDSFAFAAKDASLTSTPVTVSISVSQVNTVPIAQVQSVTTDEDMAKAITLVANDAEGDALTYLIAIGPAHGSLSAVSLNQVTYTPAANYNGPDSFTFRASDAALTSTPATVSITVTAVNDAPVAQAQNVITAEDTAKAITLVATDSDGDALTYAVVTGPSHGSLSVVSSNAITYTPAANYSGPDSFSFKTNDGLADSAPATVSITVTPVNDAPAAQSQNVTTDEDTAVAITLSASDVENAPLTYLIATVPAHGTLSAVSSNQVTYTPAANYNGPDSFTFRASDGSLTGAMATVSIAVTPVNDAPVAQAQSISTVKNTDKVITLVATDVDGDTRTYQIATGPAHGTLSEVSSNRVTYTPEAEYTGPDSFTFKANDGLSDSAPATVSITVTAGIVLPPNNTAPVAQAQSVTTAEDTAKGITLVATDAQTNAMTYLIVTHPTHGTLSVIASNQVTYTPALNYAGLDSFTFTATDGGLTGTPATVSITVTAVNDAPAALEQTVSTPVGTSISITLTGTDAEGDYLRYTLLTDPSHGTLGRLTGGRVTYKPATGFNGVDSFTFRARDASVTSMPATVYIRVGYVNTRPTIDVIPSVISVVGETTQFLAPAHDSDVPSSTLSYTLGAMVNPPATMPVLDLYTGQFTWTATGVDEGKSFLFNVIVTDDGLPSLSTNQTFQVSVAGRPPVAGISLLNGVPRLVWNSVPPRRYQLRFKDKLTDPSWTNLGGEVTATGSTLFYDDESAQSHTNRFYRVLLIPEL